jgi:DNA-binding helix-hairpin-helix protein with protein kinase domain
VSTGYHSSFDGATIITDDGRRFTLSDSCYLGGGKDGEVFRLDDRLAVKMYNTCPISSSLREKLMTLCAQKSDFHACVVSPLQLVRMPHHKSDQAAGFVMRYLPNARTLDHIRWNPGIPADLESQTDHVLANLIYDISDALRSLHNPGRVFICDLKPENVLISGHRAFLVDFDSCALPNYNGDSVTIQYVDPLIRDGVPGARGPYQFSAASDWWALGVIAFELFMGVSPWDGVNRRLLKHPEVFRSFNYSAVYYDQAVKPPEADIRSREWLNQHPKIDNYFKGIFSADPRKRVPIAASLDAYFPPRQSAGWTDERRGAIIAKLVQKRRLGEDGDGVLEGLLDEALGPLDAEQKGFVKPFLEEVGKTALREERNREQQRIRLLDIMFKAK